MLQLHRTPHQGHLTTAPSWPSLPSQERSVQGAHTSCSPAPGSARHTPVVSSTQPPSAGGVGALRLKPFSPHYLWHACPTCVGCPGAIGILPYRELLYKRKEWRFLPCLKAMGIRAKNPMKPSVLFVPGGVNPAAISYGPLLAVIQDEVQVVVKDLEVYATETPPPGYRLELEVEGIKRAAEAAGLKRFHLVGYSGGGASSLAFITTYPELVSSLALIEPAWIGNDLTPAEVAHEAELDRVMRLPPDERMRAFILADLRPGVESPPSPPGPPPPWMAKRPAGLEAMTRAFKTYQLNREAFCHFQQPVYLAVGDLSHPIEVHKAEILASLFPDMRVEVYAGRHHFDPPHRAEPERFARALRELWQRSEETMTVNREG